MVGQRPLAQVIVQTGLAAAEARDVIGVADTSRRAVAAHPSVSKMDRAANSFSNRGLCETGRSSAARNSVHAASVSTKSRRSASTSRACANAAVTVKLVRSVPSASAARRISASCSGGQARCKTLGLPLRLGSHDINCVPDRRTIQRWQAATTQALAIRLPPQALLRSHRDDRPWRHPNAARTTPHVGRHRRSRSVQLGADLRICRPSLPRTNARGQAPPIRT